ncbi:MAG: hypothetical protein WBA12_06095, partial [Catalinimonas sp.]
MQDFVTIDGIAYTLPALEDDLWRRLGRATADRKHAYRTGTLGTLGEGDVVSLRTVVLRRVVAAERVLL